MTVVRRLAFQAWFGLPPAEAAVLGALFAQMGGVLNRGEIATAAGVRTGSVKELISQLRKTLEVEAIDTDAAGYRLTDIGERECRAALASFAEEARAA